MTEAKKINLSYIQKYRTFDALNEEIKQLEKGKNEKAKNKQDEKKLQSLKRIRDITIFFWFELARIINEIPTIFRHYINPPWQTDSGVVHQMVKSLQSEISLLDEKLHAIFKDNNKTVFGIPLGFDATALEFHDTIMTPPKPFVQDEKGAHTMGQS